MSAVRLTAALRDRLIERLREALAVLDDENREPAFKVGYVRATVVSELARLGDPDVLERKRREDAALDARIAARRAAVQP